MYFCLQKDNTENRRYGSMLQYLPSIHRPWFESQALQGKIKSVWLLHTGQKTEIQRLLLNSVMVRVLAEI